MSLSPPGGETDRDGRGNLPKVNFVDDDDGNGGGVEDEEEEQGNDPGDDEDDDDDDVSDVSNDDDSLITEDEDDDDYDHDEDDDDDDNDDDNDDDDNDNEDDDDDDDDDDDANSANEEYYSSADHYDEDALPEFSCRYCGIHDPACVAMCVETKKWFCNAAGPGQAASHLVHHLVRSRSNQVQLHPESPLGDTVLECYNCASKNVFVLGFVPAACSSVVVLLCRVCVETVPALKDMDWELAQWHPLVQDRKFLPWLIKVPSDVLQSRARDVTAQQMTKLEELWKSGKTTARYSDLIHGAGGPLGGMNEEEELEPIPRQFDDGFHYQNMLAPLVKMEADYDRQMKESLTEESVHVRWEKSLAGRWVCIFSFHRLQAEGSRIVVGDELRLKLGLGAEFLHGGSVGGTGGGTTGGGGSNGNGGGSGGGGGGKPWSGVGYVKDIVDGEVELELKSGTTAVPEHVTEDYAVEYIWKSTSYDRMQNALKTFAIDDTSVTGYLYHKLLGHAVEEQRIATAKIPATAAEFAVPGLPPLNESQTAAVAAVLQRPMSLIQGPPGTGKTVTSATLVYHLVQQGMGQVLVTAPSNVAVDQLTEKIAATGLRVVRLASKTREQCSSSVDHLCLHVMVPAAAGDEFNKLQRLKDEIGELADRDGKKYRQLRNRTERDILQAADVICCTCVGAGDPRLKHFRFRQVLIDEATQAVEAEALIPIAAGAKQVVFVGDHCQLGPVVMCKTAAKAGLTQSMFERLVLIGNRPIRLAVQYRMHPALSEFPSNMFYEGSLQNGVTESDRLLLQQESYAGREDFPWPVPNKPMFFYSVTGMEEISASGTSYLNRTEAAYVEKVVTHFLRMGVTPQNMGVITPYDGQKKYLQEYMRRAGPLAAALYEALEVASVDAFQGREKDFILVSCVRSSETAGIGFLSDPRRLNVALTRARLGLVLFGNPRVLAKNALWAALLLHFKEYDCLVEGPVLGNLQPSYMTFSRPRRNPANDARYAFTALARGGWDGRWEDRRYGGGHGHHGGHGGGGGGDFGGRHNNNSKLTKRQRQQQQGQADSRFDRRYDNNGGGGGYNNPHGGDHHHHHHHHGGDSGLPIPSFAPLPSYATGGGGGGGGGGDDLSSVGGDSAYDSQYGSTAGGGGGPRSSFASQQHQRHGHHGGGHGHGHHHGHHNQPKGPPMLGYFVGGAASGNYYSTNNANANADNNTTTQQQQQQE